ncbi:MAG: hypothetical protein ACK502_03040 [Alphaproteobacteria bacterium]
MNKYLVIIPLILTACAGEDFSADLLAGTGHNGGKLAENKFEISAHGPDLLKAKEYFEKKATQLCNNKPYQIKGSALQSYSSREYGGTPGYFITVPHKIMQGVVLCEGYQPSAKTRYTVGEVKSSVQAPSIFNKYIKEELEFELAKHDMLADSAGANTINITVTGYKAPPIAAELLFGNLAPHALTTQVNVNGSPISVTTEEGLGDEASYVNFSSEHAKNIVKQMNN